MYRDIISHERMILERRYRQIKRNTVQNEVQSSAAQFVPENTQFVPSRNCGENMPKTIHCFNCIPLTYRCFNCPSRLWRRDSCYTGEEGLFRKEKLYVLRSRSLFSGY